MVERDSASLVANLLSVVTSHEHPRLLHRHCHCAVRTHSVAAFVLKLAGFFGC